MAATDWQEVGNRLAPRETLSLASRTTPALVVLGFTMLLVPPLLISLLIGRYYGNGWPEIMLMGIGSALWGFAMSWLAKKGASA